MEEVRRFYHPSRDSRAPLARQSSSRPWQQIEGHKLLCESLRAAQSNTALEQFFGRYLLSPAERRALIGAVAGLSKYELAGEIGCSPRTLETHWTRIFNKVGIRSTEGVLAAMLRCLLLSSSADASAVRVFSDMTRP
ncbi:MAG TPA: helix-turn-helix transcriptional regulator [Polyangiaceae bacterium]|nr:helix-turn-helix transcriptional regulator [Polyangiaceae bacterium]